MIGDNLRTEREKRNLTIRDIEKGTSIRALYIESIEKGDYAQLPGEVYVKGFIRNYANFLKLDADALVKQYVAETNPEAAKPEPEPEEESKLEDTVKTTTAKPFITGSDFKERVERSHHRQNMMLLAVIILVVAAGAVYLFGFADSGKSSKAPVQTAQPAKTVDTAKQEAAPKVSGVELSATFTDKCWVSVKVDGKDVFEGTMEKGKTESWKGKENVAIVAGNAGAVTLKLNGQDLGKAGKDGQVVEKTYTPDGEATQDSNSKEAKNDKKDSKQ